MRGLLGFLSMAAEGDLKNALAKERRRQVMEVPLSGVDLEAVAGNRLVGPGADPDRELDLEELRRGVDALFDDPRDRKMAELVLDGERATEPFVRLLGLQDVPAEEQRREVKRHKDRIKKRLDRYGQSIRRRQRE